MTRFKDRETFVAEMLGLAEEWVRRGGDPYKRGQLARALEDAHDQLTETQRSGVPEPLTAGRSAAFLDWWHEEGRDLVPWSPVDYVAAEIGFEAGRRALGAVAVSILEKS